MPMGPSAIPLAKGLATVSAGDIRRELKLINDADATEVSGIWKIPCRHCWGANNQFQYTNAEFYYIEQAHSYGESGWPFSCITPEFGVTLLRHAQAAWVAGKQGRALDIKGGDGYSKLQQPNRQCTQCAGHGDPMIYLCDTRMLSEGGKKLFRGVKAFGDRLEVLLIDRQMVREMLARDVQVGVERKEVVVNLPRTQEEFAKAVQSISRVDLEQFVANMITVSENDYRVLDNLPAVSSGPKLRRGN